MALRLAILGWGSLLWDYHRDFDTWHEPWQYDGPVLRIEFSRISSSRGGALTLVIDPENGAPTKVAYCISRREKTSEVFEDLQNREGTSEKNIGILSHDRLLPYHHQATAKAIMAWAGERELDDVFWTDLPSNFAKKVGQKFTVENAIDYLEKLDCSARKKAFEYVHKAPSFIQTPLRQALEVTS